MALFIPGVAGPDYRRRALAAARELLQAVGYGSPAGPWLPLGVGLNAGQAYVGNVGTAVVDFTALGDAVNVAARLQGRSEEHTSELQSRQSLVCRLPPEKKKTQGA